MSARVMPLGRVVRAEEAGLYQDAAGALRMAASREAALGALAAEERRAARAQADADAATAAAGEAARSLAAASAGIVRELAGLRMQMADVIADAVASIIGALPPAEVTARAAAHAIATLQDRAGITLRVPPAHVGVVEASVSGEGLRVIADAALGPEEMVIETAAGFVRGGAKAQLQRLREALQSAAGTVL